MLKRFSSGKWGLFLFHIEDAAFQSVSGGQDVFAGVQGIHASALRGGTQHQRTIPVAVQPDTHGAPSAGEGSQGHGIVQAGLDWDQGMENGTVSGGFLICYGWAEPVNEARERAETPVKAEAQAEKPEPKAVKKTAKKK